VWLEWERAGITSRLPLNRPLTIGRDAGCDIRMAEPTVSRRHAVVSLVGGQPLVDATGSTNGIQLDRGRADRVSLSVGQSFRIGDATFRVIGAQGPAQGPAAVPAAVLGPASCPAVAGAPFGQPPIAYRGSPAPGRPRPRPAMVLGLGAAFLVALVAVAGIGYLAVSKLAPAAPQALGLDAATLDPDAPAFPVPSGSTLINAQMEGSGAAAYRIAAWQSGKDYATTAAFYTGLSDSRWQVSGTPATTPQSTDITFADGSGVFADVDVEVSRTDPVKIDVRFVSKSGPPAQSFAPGPTMELHPLPAATTLPDGFPPELVPAGTTLKDAGAIGSTYFALYSGSVDVSAYQKQIGSLVTITGTHTESGSTVIDFTLNGHPGQVVIDPTLNEVSVEVTK
jgi:hypothetical protein